MYMHGGRMRSPLTPVCVHVWGEDALAGVGFVSIMVSGPMGTRQRVEGGGCSAVTPRAQTDSSWLLPLSSMRLSCLHWLSGVWVCAFAWAS